MGPEVPGRGMPGHICAHTLKLGSKIKQFFQEVVSFLANFVKWGSVCRKKAGLGPVGRDLGPVAAPSLPQFSSSVKRNNSCLVFPDSQG